MLLNKHRNGPLACQETPISSITEYVSRGTHHLMLIGYPAREFDPVEIFQDFDRQSPADSRAISKFGGRHRALVPGGDLFHQAGIAPQPGWQEETVLGR